MTDETQDEPVLDQTTAAEQERLDGLIAQLRADEDLVRRLVAELAG